MSKLDVFRFCRLLRHLGNVMILVVLALVCLVSYSVSVGYIDLFKRGSILLRFVCVLVLASFFALVRFLSQMCSPESSSKCCLV